MHDFTGDGALNVVIFVKLPVKFQVELNVIEI